MEVQRRSAEEEAKENAAAAAAVAGDDKGGKTIRHTRHANKCEKERMTRASEGQGEGRGGRAVLTSLRRNLAGNWQQRPKQRKQEPLCSATDLVGYLVSGRREGEREREREKCTVYSVQRTVYR